MFARLGNNANIVTSQQTDQKCGSNRQPASGIRGRAGLVVDAVGLMCDEP